MIAAVVPLLAAAAPAGEGHPIAAILVTLVAVILGTKLFGEIAQRAGQPSVLGELIAGIVLGGSVLGILDPTDAVIAALAELGVLVLLFEIGLHTDLQALVKVGRSAALVGVVGLTLPFVFGYAAATALGVPTLPALVCAASLTATSIGISARVLSDLGQLRSREGQVVLGAAVLDDVLGLVILSVIAGVVAGAEITAAGVGLQALVALGFVAVALLLGARAIPPIFRAVERVRTAGALGTVALAFAFLLAWAADAAGSALIVGAFAAGLILHPTPQRAAIEEATTNLGHFFVPIFFASVGAAVQIGELASPRALTIGAALVAVGVLGKVAAGYAPWWFRGRKLMIGVAMVPRGEVGLIFAQLGLASGALAPDLFGAVMLMVLATTFMTPPLLGRLARRPSGEPPADPPGEGGIDDLVAGASQYDRPQPLPR